MKNYCKNEKGVMAAYAIMTVLSFTCILSIIFGSAVSVRKMQLTTMPPIKEVYEQYIDQKYEIYEAEVEKRRDKVAPTATITLGAQSVKVGESISVTIIQQDNKDRLDLSKCFYVYNKSSSPVGTGTNSYAGGSLSNKTNNITVTFTEVGVYYIHALTFDKDKNSSETISGPISVTQDVQTTVQDISQDITTLQDKNVPGVQKDVEQNVETPN